MTHELITNAALLVSLSAVYRLIGPLRRKPLANSLLTGLLFGGIAVAGMIIPVHYSGGIIYDGRSIVLTLAGLFGGGTAVLTAAAAAAVFRIYLGGAGIWAGLATIVFCSLTGLAFRRHSGNQPEKLSLPVLYLAGVITHVIMLACQLLLPRSQAMEVISRIWLPVMTVFPAATLLIGLFLKNEEERFRYEEALKKNLEEKVILLKEIHHRVKNNLNVITSLLNLQSGRIHSKEDAVSAFQNTRDRVYSMALVHEKLYKSDDFSRIDMGPYTESLTRELKQMYARQRPVTLSLDIQAPRLNINLAIPCGMIINELVTNAFKHAFTEETGGEICVHLLQEKEGRLCLSVEDNGRGLPKDFDIETSGSLGLQIVKLLSRQIRGSLEIHHSNTCFIIRFPAGA